MISLRPACQMIGGLLGHPPGELEVLAVERWEIAPAEPRHIRPARMLPGQIDRMRGAEFGTMETVRRDLLGSFDVTEGPTLGFRLRDIDLIDGVLRGPGRIGTCASARGGCRSTCLPGKWRGARSTRAGSATAGSVTG